MTRAKTEPKKGVGNDVGSELLPVHTRLPNKDELQVLPRWALVAYSYRCVQRMFPLCGVDELGTVAAKETEVLSLLDHIRQAITTGNRLDDETWSNANNLQRDRKKTIEKYVVDAIYFMSSAAHSEDPQNVLKATNKAATSMWKAAKADIQDSESRILAAFWQDLEQLHSVAEKEGWTDGTPVPIACLEEPLWPKGLPKGWPGETESHSADEDAILGASTTPHSMSEPREEESSHRAHGEQESLDIYASIKEEAIGEAKRLRLFYQRVREACENNPADIVSVVQPVRDATEELLSSVLEETQQSTERTAMTLPTSEEAERELNYLLSLPEEDFPTVVKRLQQLLNRMGGGIYGVRTRAITRKINLVRKKIMGELMWEQPKERDPDRIRVGLSATGSGPRGKKNYFQLNPPSGSGKAFYLSEAFPHHLYIEAGEYED